MDNVYWDCEGCGGLVMDISFRLDAAAEKARYELHNNDIHDPAYRQFLAPVSDFVCKAYSKSHLGLDYGCGPGPALAHVLKEKGFQVRLYDPFFYPELHVLSRSYDFVICTETAEHFYSPAMEFQRLSDMLKPGGRLLLMTLLYSEETDFAKWFYRRDETHVFIYRDRTMDYIARRFGFIRENMDKRFISLCKS
jgi:2-polyprenyl-3-methyl-5-hydroxy-6-metoxy-1,4-benzoquinol methylase